MISICSDCGEKLRVRDSRPVKNGRYIYRKRVCPKCGRETITMELLLDDAVGLTGDIAPYSSDETRNRSTKSPCLDCPSCRVKKNAGGYSFICKQTGLEICRGIEKDALTILGYPEFCPEKPGV